MTRRTARPTSSARGAWSNDKNSGPEPLIGEPADHAIGRSRGGLTTKVHALTDGTGRVLVVLLTGGNVHDSPMFAQLLSALRVARSGTGRPRTRPDYLLADKGYSSRANRRMLRERGIGHTIPEKTDQAANRRRRGSAGGRPPGFDPYRYARRNTIERGFCQLKQWRGLATRYDKHARNYAGALSLAALLTWLP
jgi:transposase